MELRFPAAVFTADHGYHWSAVPDGIRADARDRLLADALSTRPDFAEPDDVSAGVAVCEGLAAAFTIRRAPAWDAVGRDADYSAFAFVPCAEAAAVDFAALLTDPFFETPTHTPPAFLTYTGPASGEFPLNAPGRLLCHNRLDGFNAHALGTLLARYAAKADHWLCVAATPSRSHSATFTITTSSWHS